MTKEQKNSELLEAEKLLECIRSDNSLLNPVFVSVVSSIELYIEALQSIDLNRVRSFDEMNDIDALFVELKSNYEDQLGLLNWRKI